MKRFILVFVLLASAINLPGYVRSTTSGGTPLRRTDSNNIQFLINDEVAAGLTNSEGATWITADSDPIAALRASVQHWDDVSTAAVSFAPLTSTAIGHEPGDSNHVFVFIDTPEIRSAVGGALAVTRSRFFLNGEFTDTDIVFNPTTSFSTTLATDTFDIEGVATHEVGHALGANHTVVGAASMFPRTPPEVNLQSQLSDDDTAFLTAAYPAPGVLDARGQIRGTVSLSAGGAATGVLVTATDPDAGVTIGTLSDLDDGTYTLGPLPPGGYLVSAEAAAGLVDPTDFSAPNAGKFKTDVLTLFAGGNFNPQTMQVLAGSDLMADITVEQGAPTFRIEFLGTGRAETEGNFRGGIGPAAVSLVAGEVDLVFVGQGLDASLTADNIRLLAPGVTLRGLIVDSTVSLNGMPVLRATLDVAARQGRDVGSLVIVKDGAASAFTGAIAIEGSDAPPPVGPQIGAGGVVLSTGTPVVTQISSNSIITIFGQDFAPQGTLVLNPDLLNGRVSTRLADTCVEINGNRSPMFAVLPTQINLQVSSDVNPGNGAVAVIRGCGTGNEQRSAPENVAVASVSPGFFNFVNNANGENPIAALHQDGSSLAGPAGLFPGVTPAAPGEFVSLFATGFGPTSPAFESGEIPGQVASVIGNVSVSIDGAVAPPGDLFYAGVAPCCAGLYQVVVKIPDNAANGNLPVVLSVDGVATPSGPFIAVSQ